MRVGVSSIETDADTVAARVLASPGMTGADLAREVSTPQPYAVPARGERRHRVAALDLGIKRSTPARMAAAGCEVHVLPATATAGDLLAEKPDGVFISNGPGDPATADYAIEALRGVLDAGVPVFGICFGNQLLGRALGLSTYKLRYGHRGVNQPVQDRATGAVAVTSHNHGFAVDAATDGPTQTPYGAVEVSHVDLNDGVVEGLRCLDVPAFSVQYRPGAARRHRAVRGVRRADGDRAGAGVSPRRADIDHVLVIGSGPIVIGQACEFDYSGTQACRVLRAEGLRVSLVNSNPATIMTDPEFADATYIEPVTPEVVAQIIARERPDAVLATLGGQTALNTAVALHDAGILERYGVVQG